jgi:aryl sulfotransferase
LIHAYWTNGFLDINFMPTSTSDSQEPWYRLASSVELKTLGSEGQFLIRPTVLLNQLAMWPLRPMFMKTHQANVIPAGTAPLIPKALTTRAVYIVRDPRDIVPSLATFMGKSVDLAVTAMNTASYAIGRGSTEEDGGESDLIETCPSLVCSWSMHVKSWMEETDYPVLIVKYEDLLADTEAELTRILEFCGMDIDAERVKTAVDTCVLEKLRKQEEAHGFNELRYKERGVFFGKGGSRWSEELSPEHIKQVETDHEEMMTRWGYLKT